MSPIHKVQHTAEPSTRDGSAAPGAGAGAGAGELAPDADLPFYTERSLAIACTRGREAIVTRFHALLATEGFTEQQWRVMRILYDFEPVPLAEICRLACIHKVSMTRIVRALMEKGFVTRARQNGDRRAYDVSLTPRGRRLLAKMTPIAADIYRGIARDFGPEKTQLLLRLLKELSTINGR